MKYETYFHIKFYTKEKRFISQAKFSVEGYTSEEDCLNEAKHYVKSQLGTKEWLVNARGTSELLARDYATIEKVKSKLIEEFSNDPNSVRFIVGK